MSYFLTDSYSEIENFLLLSKIQKRLQNKYMLNPKQSIYSQTFPSSVSRYKLAFNVACRYHDKAKQVLFRIILEIMRNERFSLKFNGHSNGEYLTRFISLLNKIIKNYSIKILNYVLR